MKNNNLNTAEKLKKKYHKCEEVTNFIKLEQLLN